MTPSPRKLTGEAYLSHVDQTREVDVAIVGAGPAGCAAAIEATRAGYTVEVVDKASAGRDKTCGDGLTTEALRLLEHLGWQPEQCSTARQIDTVMVRAPGGRTVALPLPVGGLQAVTVTRADLDRSLGELAASAGAAVTYDWTVADVAVTTDGVTLLGPDGDKVTASIVLAADGAWSPLRKKLCPPKTPHLGAMHAYRQYVTGFTDDRLWVIFQQDLGAGYVWAFPLGNGIANIGFGIHRQPGVSTKGMSSLWEEIKRRPSVADVLGHAEPIEKARAWPIPANLDDTPLAFGRVLFIGDAAAATDPLTGEGIAQALWTGIEAARSLRHPGRPLSSSEVAAIGDRYRARVLSGLARDMRFARRLRRVLASARRADMAIAVTDLSDWTRRNFARWLFEDYPRALLVTPDRWDTEAGPRRIFGRPPIGRMPYRR